ncbi:MAG: hypothetical protein IJX36_01610, partial [Thermoguttaceae bacterium]|nr:hypothetical protein [Thermoguttaceae bacterium]
MSESLLQISCPSCESVFAVTDPELIGQIVACPKCGGMILVEAAQNASNERVGEETQNAAEAQNKQDAQNGEGEGNAAQRQVEQDAQNGRNALKIPVGEEPRVAKETQDEDGEAETTANEDAASAKEKRRVGKWVGGGVAFLLVGAAAFFATRNCREDSAPNLETGVEAKIGQNGESGESATSENDASDDVGGFAPFAVKERTAGDESETAELTASTSETSSEDAGFEGNDEAESVGEDGQNGEKGRNGENENDVAIFENVESSDASSEAEGAS